MSTNTDAAVTGASTCAVKPANLSRPKAVTVNGVIIPRAEIARETQNHPASKPVEAWLAAAQALVVRELLLQEARRLAIAPLPIGDGEGRRETDDEALVRQLVEQEVVTPTPDEAACRRIYEQNRHRFRSSDLYAARHILLTAPPGNREARREAHRKAEQICTELARDPSMFASLAATHSACSSGGNGGELGQLSHGQTVPEFEAALAEAPVGAVCSTPIETRYGFHVVMVDQRLDGKALPFDAVEAQIAEWLSTRSRHAAIRQYIAFLAGQAAIVGIDFNASASPLVQ